MGFLARLFKRSKPKEPEPPMAPLSFEEALQRSGLAEFRAQFEIHLKNSVFAISTTSTGERSPLGSSHLGGFPDLPRGVTWPHVDHKPLAFIGQFNLAETKSFNREGLLPQAGFLFFFYDNDQSAWGFDPADKDHWSVIFHAGPAEDLSRVPAPTGLDDYSIFRECRVHFSTQPTLPNECPKEAEGCSNDDYSELLAYLGAFHTHHQLLGHESPIQGDVKLECQLVTNGLYCGDSSGYNDPRAEELRHGVKDWVLLLQVDSDDKPQMMWGDLGRLYFCIRRHDLANHKFEKVWMVFQCH